MFNLTTHEVRRERGDLIQFYKIVHGLEEVTWVKEMRRIDSNSAPVLRRHVDHFYRESKACSVRENFFVNRVIPLWNGLPKDVKDAPSLDAFKAGLDRLPRFST